MSDSPAKRLLIVEDDPVIRKVLTLQFTKDSFSVTTAQDGAEGFATLRQEIPDCIILDLMMPVMDGFELLKRIRSVGRTANVPVIILTASQEDRHRLKGSQYQADAYLNKPYRLEELGNLVRQLCGLATVPPS